MKLIVKSAKPRNPFVAPSLMRRAGTHRPVHQRQQSQRLLRRELDALRHSP